MKNKILTTVFEIIVSIAIATLFILLFISCSEKKLTKQEQHQKQIESLFFYNGGPHKTANHYLSNQLNDPNSLENVSCVYIEDTINHIVKVKWEFTATNPFGGRVRDYVLFDSDTLGNIVKVHKWIE